MVLDTSVMVAALRSNAGASRVVLEAAFAGKLTPLLSVPLMLEYEAVITRSEHLAASGLTIAEVNGILDGLAAVSEPVRLAFHWRPMLRDANDDMVLEVAVNGGADGLVTFNERDFSMATKEFRIRILSPREVVRRLEVK
ncbi:MAG TPA: putative toxin-antitoxin system toxin component, PIN family [Acidobacteriaceae bacterium]|jgi:putative PIN family toxin of toxin-antitoxin system|nr:putative toxin-antitoxin system toxin component, PIN family [Acidobacteriaceae bacterium]